MSIGQHIINFLLPPSKAEAATNAIAGASVTTVIFPTWWPSEESLTHELTIIYLAVSILWVAVNIGFKFYNGSKDDASN